MVNLLGILPQVFSEISDAGCAQFFQMGLQMGDIPFDQSDGCRLKQLAISFLAFPERLLRPFQIGIVFNHGHNTVDGAIASRYGTEIVAQMGAGPLGVDIGMFGDNRFLLGDAALNIGNNPRCRQCRTIEEVDRCGIVDSGPGKQFQHLAVDAGDTALDIEGEDSQRGAIAQKSVSFFKGPEGCLGLLAALFNPLQFGNLSAQCADFSHKLFCSLGFLRHAWILRMGALTV